jgi:hypothetical protein
MKNLLLFHLSVQIRRGDKIGSEARNNSVDQYMFYVINYYKKLGLKGFTEESCVRCF